MVRLDQSIRSSRADHLFHLSGYTWTPSRISGNFLVRINGVTLPQPSSMPFALQVYREVVERLTRNAYQMPANPDLIQRAETHGALKVQGLVKKVRQPACGFSGGNPTYLLM